jgi:hypothetical protein
MGRHQGSWKKENEDVSKLLFSHALGVRSKYEGYEGYEG